MKITVFTSNQPRHLAYVSQLATIADSVYAVLESNTVFPGKIEDFFIKSPVMQSYFDNVLSSEKRIFGGLTFTPTNVRVLALKAGDLNLVARDVLEPALSSDYYLVFGASFIRGWLADELVMKKAINVHMGISPYYRGSSCNFWALYDNMPNFVGATVHLLSRGLDSGPILFHSQPVFRGQSLFDFAMESVFEVQNKIVGEIGDNRIFSREAIEQDPDLIIRYSKNRDFTDDVASEYLQRSETPESIMELFATSPKPDLSL